jgi:predicted Zn-dependent protease
VKRALAFVGMWALAACGGGLPGLSKPELSKDSLNEQNLKKGSDVAKTAFKAIKSLTEEMTPEQEYWVGRSIATNIMAKADYKSQDKAAIADGRLEGLTAYVNSVGNVVAAAAMGTHRDGDRPAPVAGWHFVVLDSDQINAFASPGGFVFVTAAAVKLAKSEDELAGILGHEIAHVVRGHALGNIKKSRYASVSADALHAAGSAALSPEQVNQLTELMGGMIDDTIQAMFVKGYSRDTEFEADDLGVKFASAAGYDPQGMTRFLGSLAKSQDTGKGGFYDTHPKASDRLGKLSGTVKSLPAVTVPRVRVERFATASEKLR